MRCCCGPAARRAWRTLLLTGLGLAFAVIPEELPLLALAVVSIGALRLARRRLLLRRVRAAEALGAITVLVTDKTGTLTYGTLRLAELVVPAELDARAVRCMDAALPSWGAEPVDLLLLCWILSWERLPQVTVGRTTAPGDALEQLHMTDPFDAALTRVAGAGASRLVRTVEEGIAHAQPAVEDELPFEASRRACFGDHLCAGAPQKRCWPCATVSGSRGRATRLGWRMAICQSMSSKRTRRCVRRSSENCAIWASAVAA